MPHQCTNCGREFPDGSKEMLSGCPDCGSNKFQFTPAGADDAGESASDAGAASGDAETDAEDDTTDDPFGEWPDEATPSDDRAEPTAPDRGDWPDPSGSRGDDSDAERDGPPSETTADAGRSSSARNPPTDADATADAGRSETGREDLSTGREDLSTGRSDPPTEERSADETPTADETATDETNENAAQASARSEVVSPEELPETGATDRTDAPTDPGSTDFDRLREELNDQFESIRIVSPGTYELNLMELYDRQEYIISLREDGRYVIEMPGAWDSPDD